jgi:hypothetical protein
MASRKVAAAYVSLELQIANFKAAIGEAQGLTKKMAAEMREEMAKSKESVKLLSEELGLGIPRGLQGIISKLPGITTAMNAAFDLVVVFALGKTIYEVGEKIVEMVHKSEEAAAKHREMFNGLTISMEHTNDSLRVQSDSLQRSIDKIEHKPHNGIKDAIDEAIAESDKLGEKLDANIKQIAAGLAGEAPGKIDWLLGATYDKGPKEVIDKLKRSMEEIELGKSSLPGDKDEQRRNALFVAKSEAEGNSAKVAPDQWTDPKIAEANAAKERGQYQTIAAGVSESMDTVDLMRRIAAQTSTLKQDESKSKTENPAVKAYFENMKKNLEEQIHRTEADTREWESALREQGVGAIEGREKGQLKKEHDDLEANTRAAKEYWEAWGRGESEATEHAAKLSELQIKIAEAHGAMTPHEAAMATANAHQAAYNALMEHYSDLLTKIAAQLAAGYLTPEQAGAQREGITVDQQAARNSHQTQGLEDAQAEWGTSFTGQVEETFNDIIAKSEDWGKQFKETVEGALTSVNNAILKLLTEKPQPGQNPFKDAGKQIFEGIAKTGLQDAEGQLLKASGIDSLMDKLGITHGKLGTKSNPMITKDVNAGSGSGSGGGSGSGSGDSGGDSPVTGLAGKFLDWANDSDFMGKHFGNLFGPGGALFDAHEGGFAGGSGASKLGIKESPVPGDVNKWAQLGIKGAGMAYGATTGGSNSGSDSTGGYADTQGVTPNGFFNNAGDFMQYGSNAGGGVVSPGDWSMVGEAGPELAHFGSGARIYNNRDTKAMLSGGGSTTHNWTIDARGATDPAAINAAVQRGIRQAAPHLVKASAQSQHDHTRRTPSRK